MIHIKQILNKIVDNASKAKFYRDNQDLFVRYFESQASYIAKINAGRFDDIEQIIKGQTNFTMSIVENVVNNLTKK